MKAVFDLAGLLAAYFLLTAGNALIGVLAPLRAKLEGIPEPIIGLFGSAFFFGMLGGTLGAPILIRRVGHVKAFPAFVTLAVVATMLLPLRVEPAVWVALRAATGFAFAGIFAVTESWINARARNANRGRIYAVYQLVNFVAGTLGQWSLGALQIGGAAAFLAGGALIAASVVPLLASHAQSPPAPRSIRPRPLWIARLAPVSAFASLVAGVANGSVWALGPLYAVGIGVPATDVPAFTSAIIVGSAAGVFPAGLLSDRIDRRLAPAFEMGVGAVAEFALSMLHAPGAAMIVLGFMVGATTFTCYTISMSHAADRARGQEFVAVSTSMLAIYCFGAISGPALGSMAMQAFGPSALFTQNAATHAGLTLFALIAVFAGRAKAAKAQL